MDFNPPGSSIRGVLQARILEWVAISFSRESSQPRDQTQVSRTAGRCCNLWAIREAQWHDRVTLLPTLAPCSTFDLYQSSFTQPLGGLPTTTLSSSSPSFILLRKSLARIPQQASVSLTVKTWVLLRNDHWLFFKGQCVLQKELAEFLGVGVLGASSFPKQWHEAHSKPTLLSGTFPRSTPVLCLREITIALHTTSFPFPGAMRQCDHYPSWALLF